MDLVTESCKERLRSAINCGAVASGHRKNAMPRTVFRLVFDADELKAAQRN